MIDLQNKLTLPINNSAELLVEFTGSVNKLRCGDWATVTLLQKNVKIRLKIDADIALETFRSLHYQLTEILDENITIAPELQYILGLKQQQIYQEQCDDILYTNNNGKEAYVESYLLWNVPQAYSTWLYAKDNKIFLEITPSYPWTFVKPTKKEKFYTFDEFVKNYKPYAIFEISKKTAREWQQKAQKNVDIIEASCAQLCQKQTASFQEE